VNFCCRFAQFFICPLLSADATSREINAVDSGAPLSAGIHESQFLASNIECFPFTHELNLIGTVGY
jgi:hypothetical protein